MKLEFTKMEGLGNDYIYIDTRRFPVADPGALSVRLSDRHFGIGSDGLVLIGAPSAIPSEVEEPSFAQSSPQTADFSMRIFNADGSEAQMCGNAIRCVGKYLNDRGITDKTVLDIQTLSGVRRLHLHKGPDGLVQSATVGMGRARIVQPYLQLELSGAVVNGIVVDVGNPHFVVFCPDADAVDIERLGPAIERHPLFPDRINVEFVSVLPADAIPSAASSTLTPGVLPSDAEDPSLREMAPSGAKSPSALRMRVWERGSGITLACGTGACASVAAARASGVVGSPCTVLTDGGPLQISCSIDGTLLMKGPARTVFDGTLEI